MTDERIPNATDKETADIQAEIEQYRKSQSHADNVSRQEKAAEKWYQRERGATE